jgi:hypothetical protein
VTIASQQASQAPTPPPIPPLPTGPVQGEAVTVQPSPSIVQVSPDIPPEVVPIVGIVFGSLALMVIVTPIVRGIMRMIERRQEKTLVHGPAVAQQLAQLQQSIDTLAIEVERISESQRFQAKVLAERERPAIGGGGAGGR